MNLRTEMCFENNHEKLQNNDGELNIMSSWHALGKKGYCRPCDSHFKKGQKSCITWNYSIDIAGGRQLYLILILISS